MERDRTRRTNLWQNCDRRMFARQSRFNPYFLRAAPSRPVPINCHWVSEDVYAEHIAGNLLHRFFSFFYQGDVGSVGRRGKNGADGAQVGEFN